MVSSHAMSVDESMSQMCDRLDSAKLVGWNEKGLMCVWYGGYSFNVYDVLTGWNEVDHFTSGQISGLSEKDSPEGRGCAKARMRSEGYTVVE